VRLDGTFTSPFCDIPASPWNRHHYFCVVHITVPDPIATLTTIMWYWALLSVMPPLQLCPFPIFWRRLHDSPHYWVLITSTFVSCTTRIGTSSTTFKPERRALRTPMAVIWKHARKRSRGVAMWCVGLISPPSRFAPVMRDAAFVSLFLSCLFLPSPFFYRAHSHSTNYFFGVGLFSAVHQKRNRT